MCCNIFFSAFVYAQYDAYAHVNFVELLQFQIILLMLRMNYKRMSASGTYNNPTIQEPITLETGRTEKMIWISILFYALLYLASIITLDFFLLCLVFVFFRLSFVQCG